MFRKAFIRVITQFLDYVLPGMCLICGANAEKNNVCLACYQDLPILPNSCERCALFLPAHADSNACAFCLKSPPAFEKTFALFPYQAPIGGLIKHLKFKQDLASAKFFSDLLHEKILSTWYKNTSLPQLILPVPLHPLRLKRRGFNQAVEIARPLAKKLGLPLDLFGLKRIKDTAAQSGLSKKLRRMNIKSAFECQQKYGNLCIALIDDVVTTGLTIREISRVLKINGAKTIHVWCCARRG